MKMEIYTYCCALFLATLILFKGLIAVLPGSFYKGQKAIETALLIENEEEENKKTGEKNTGEYGYEQCILSFCQHYNTGVDIVSSTKILAQRNNCYSQLVYLSIPTPPPKRA